MGQSQLIGSQIRFNFEYYIFLNSIFPTFEIMLDHITNLYTHYGAGDAKLMLLLWLTKGKWQNGS